MHKVRVRDPQGATWTVRARRLRSTETTGPMSRPEQESLHRRITRALAPHPGVAVDPMRGAPNAWWTPGDTADIEMREARRANRDLTGGHVGGTYGVLAFVRLVIEVIDHLRTPMTDTWQLEAVARGRMRRWARWEVAGPGAAERVAAEVAAALTTGRVPQPDGAVLVDVVDQRPPPAPRWTAALGGARPVG